MIGEQFGNYRAVSLLGEGGMGSVYLAEHPSIGRRVAVKVLHKNFIRDEGLLTRFLNEARAANAIRHPNIIEILDSGTIADGTPFLVMELLEGESLGVRLRRVGALPIPTAVDFTYQTASALGAAHKKGIVHRDLKPDNLFVVPDPHEPDRERIKVLDFGIAKLQQGNVGDSVKTRTGTLMGTPIYMSPEQCRGTRSVDHRSDIYSLGVIFFEMMVGQPPFVSEGFGELVNMHLNVAAPAPSAQRPEISPALDAVVAKMLAKNPDQRFQEMAELQQALKSAGASPFLVPGAPISSPNLGSTRPPVVLRADAASSPKLRDTTFSTGVGERVAAPAAGRKGKAALVVAGLAAAGVVGGIFIFRDGEKVGSRMEPGGSPIALASPPVPPAQPAAPIAAPPIAPPAPPKRVTVRLESDPTGATVVDDAGGAILGTTPLALTRPRGGALKVHLLKEGYTPGVRALSLDDDQTLALTLEPKPKPRARKTSHAPAADEPAKL